MLKNMTVKELREIAKRESVKGYSTMVKAELVALLTRVIEDDHEVALNIDADMEEEKHMKEAEAERIASGRQYTKDGIVYGAGWSCCAESPSKVIVFDNDVKWAVCNGCASAYTGEVQELPAEIKAFPGKTFMGRIAAYKNDNGRSGFLTARQQRRIAKKWKSAISKGYNLDVVMGDK